MTWHSTHEFFAMGGYGAYVWSAYAVTAALLGVEAWLARRRRRRALERRP
ncbi:MAG TPA: heme exporter protein CcmD [Burkholderiaceae bacterium]|nr:heme exporter protein CcmD [Burkholderiaceae bacterium]